MTKAEEQEKLEELLEKERIDLTQEDIAKIQEEIDYRKQELGPQLRERLQTARAQGDLSENFEYTMAKRENNQNNSRVHYLEGIIRRARIFEDRSAEDEVGLNKKVTIYIPEDDEEETYKIVSSLRGDSMENRISKESPLGEALMGKKVGDTVTIKVNAGFSYEAVIRKIEIVPDDGSDSLRQF